MGWTLNMNFTDMSLGVNSLMDKWGKIAGCWPYVDTDMKYLCLYFILLSLLGSLLIIFEST